MKKNILILILGLVVTSVAFSQKQKKQHKHKPNPEAKKEMAAYIEKNVIPVLQKAQNKMDAQLSAEDLVFIQGKRKEAATLRAEKMADRKAKREDRKAMKEEFEKMTEEEKIAFKEERKSERKAMHEKMKKEHGGSKAEVKAFMERNQELITNTMTALKPNYKKWTTDQRAILEKYIPEDAPKRKMKKQGRVGLFGLKPHGKRHGKHKGHRGHHGEKAKGDNSDGKERGQRKHGKKHGKKGGKKIAVEFVLWDGASPAAQQREENLRNDIVPNAKIELGQNYPNPAESITRIPVDISENANQLNLIVTDLNGKVVKQLNLTNLSAGREMIELNVNDLPNGQYFYTIETNGVKESKKMTVNH